MGGGGNKHTIAPQSKKKKVVKYRCDENVLKAKPTVLKQIKVPTSPGIEYVTGMIKI